jgi:ABC-type transport system substrate-binding protein
VISHIILVEPTWSATQEDLAVTFNKAKALLKEAGYEKGFTLSLWAILALYKQVDEAAAGYLEKVGIKADIKDYVGRWPEAATLMTAGKLDGALTTSWGMFSLFDPDGFWPLFFLTPEGPYLFNTDPELMDWISSNG